MHTAVLVRISSTALTPSEKAAKVVACREAFCYLGGTSEGLEIQDCRPLMARSLEPLKGRGVVRTLGNGRHVVTAVYWAKLQAGASGR